MSINTSEVKILTANNIEASLEDQLEQTQRTVHQLEGAVQSLAQSSKLVPLNLVAKVDQEFESGSIKDGMTALEVLAVVKKFVIRCGDYLGHLSEIEKNKIIAVSGEVAGLKAAMVTVKKVLDKEKEAVSRKLLDAEEFAKSGGNGEHKNPPRTSAEAARQAHGTLSERRAKAALAEVVEETEEELEARLLGE